MQGRVGFFLGFGAGYVFGTKAGQERYQQLVRLYDNFLNSPKVKEATGKAKESVGTGLGQARQVASEGLGQARQVASEGRSKVVSTVKERRDSNGQANNLSVAPPPT
jgi:hypothetical protein